MTYDERPVADWDEEGFLWYESRDEYYSTWSEVYDAIDVRQDLAGLELRICVPVHPPTLTVDWLIDDLPDNLECPEEVLDAMQEFNDAVKHVVLRWEPGPFRPRIATDD